VELRGLLFGDRKCKDEPDFVQDDTWEPDQEKQLVVVQTIFRKA